MVWVVRNGNVVRGAKAWFRSSPGGGKCGPGGETAAPGQTLVAGNVVRGEKLRPRVKPAPPECGPGREIMVLGQTLVAGSVVQGEKPRVWVKPARARVWSVGRNCGFGSSPPPPECGPGSQTVPPGQARLSVVQGAKLRPRVKPAPARVWSREQNCGPGSSPPPPECGPGRETAAPGQARPRPSVVRGSKTVPWVKLCPARVWSRERNCGPGSNPPPPKCGPGRETAAPGQTLPRPSVVQGAKPCPRVTPVPAEAWSREQNRAPGSSPCPQVTPGPVTPSPHLKYKKESKTNI